MLSDVIDHFEYPATQKDICLRYDIAAKVETAIYSDKNRLSQILDSLVGNAIKFTNKGFITIKVKNDPMNDKRIVFWVEDTGSGIKADKVDKIFQMYGRFAPLSNRKGMKSGVGLGLTVSRLLSKALNDNKESLKL
jgi:signal transduction histidine kinase